MTLLHAVTVTVTFTAQEVVMTSCTNNFIVCVTENATSQTIFDPHRTARCGLLLQTE